jgi:hypothetical protein
MLLGWQTLTWVDQTKRVRDLERENDRLRRLVAELTLDKAILSS